MKFQKGDKIAFYQSGVKYIGYIDVIDDNLLYVRSMGGAFFYVHVKQCRKLKKKREPRRFWISLGSGFFQKDNYGPFVSSFEPKKWDGSRELIEVVVVLK